jgi:hypothetical protein
LGTTVSNTNLVHEEISSKLNSGNACYYSIQSLLFTRLLSKSVKIKIHKIIILLLVLYGCETWSLTLGEEHRLKMFENRVLKEVFGPWRDEKIGRRTVLYNEEIHNLYTWQNTIDQVKED